MRKTLVSILCALAMAACGGTSQDPEQPEPVTPGPQTGDTGSEKAPPTDDGQAEDEEVPPGLSVIDMFGSGPVAAVGDVDMNRGKQIFESFVESFVKLAADTAAAADCAAAAAAWDNWRITIIPTLKTDFVAVDTYARSMSEADKKALNEKMKPVVESMMPNMSKCAGDPAFQAAMQSLQQDFAELEKQKNKSDAEATP